MAREYAQIRLRIWNDDDFRALSPSAQHLYFVLLTSPSLSHAGVCDWRPKRIAAHARGWDIEMVEAAAEELVEQLYLVIDEDTEEVLIRSFIRHDGLMKQPKMAAAMAAAHASIASRGIRGVVIHELKRLHEEDREAKGWGSKLALELLDKGAIEASSYPCRKGSGKGSVKGSGKGSTWGSGEGSVKGSPEGSVTPNSTPNSTPTGEGSGKGSTFPAPAPTACTYNLDDSLRESGDADAPPGQDVALIDFPSPASPPDAEPPPTAITVQTVVGAWVDECRANDVTPSAAQRKQVGVQAKELLRHNDPLRVLDAARAAGAKGFASIDRELTSRNGRAVGAPAALDRNRAASAAQNAVWDANAQRYDERWPA